MGIFIIEYRLKFTFSGKSCQSKSSVIIESFSKKWEESFIGLLTSTERFMLIIDLDPKGESQRYCLI